MIDHNLTLLKPILILEDDPCAQVRIHRILKEFGYIDQDLYFSQTVDTAKHIFEENTIRFFLIDVHLPDGNGIEFIKHIRQADHSDAPILVLSAWNAYETIYDALTMGAAGYVLKERDDFEVMFAIRAMLKGEAIIDPKIAKEILKKLHLNSEQNSKNVEANVQVNLSNRELEILNLIGNGMSSREIGEKINISRFTVDVHIKKIYSKLEVNSRTKAVHRAQKIGLIN